MFNLGKPAVMNSLKKVNCFLN